jgi:hypothetical protein
MEILELFPFFVLPFFFTFVCVLDLGGGGEKLQEGVGVSFFSCDARRWGHGACFLLVSEKKTKEKPDKKTLFSCLDHGRDHDMCHQIIGWKIRLLPKRKTLGCQIDRPNTFAI